MNKFVYTVVNQYLLQDSYVLNFSKIETTVYSSRSSRSITPHTREAREEKRGREKIKLDLNTQPCQILHSLQILARSLRPGVHFFRSPFFFNSIQIRTYVYIRMNFVLLEGNSAWRLFFRSTSHFFSVQ